MTGSSKGFVAVGEGTDMFPCPLSRLLCLEVVLVGGVVVGRGRKQIGVAIFASRGVGFHVARQLVRSRETLVAVRKIARVRFFTSVCADVACLMLEAKERLVADMTFERTRDLVR